MSVITRRAGSALALALALSALPVIDLAVAAPHPVKPRVTSKVVTGVDPAVAPSAADRPAGLAPGSPTVLSAEVALPAFSVLGVTWTDASRHTPAAGSAGPSGADPIVQVRVREEQGGWTPWQTLPTADGAPDPGTAEATHAGNRRSTEPLISGTATAAQIRIDGVPGATKTIPTTATIVAIDPGSSPADATLGGPTTATARAATLRPSIIPRAAWGADESTVTCSMGWSPTIKAGFVHHTAGTNTYTPSQSAALVRGIMAYHISGRGWCDIGYNFLVDRYGQIFEGRSGGMDLAVIGAHTGGFNYKSFGVAAMGDFTTAAPPTVMLNSIGAVLGWKLGLHARDPQGNTSLISAGFDASPYAAGVEAGFRVVSGHRDANFTGCPGDQLYAQLPTLRTIAARYAVANTTPDHDLIGVLTTGAGVVEVHNQSASSNYAQRVYDRATTLPELDPAEWRVFIGPGSYDTRPDLVAVHTRNTTSGKVEVSMLTWDSGYQTVYTATTPMVPFDPDTTVQLAMGGTGGGDLSIIMTADTGSGMVEVHTLSGASDYTEWVRHAATAVPLGLARTALERFLVQDRTGDLYLILHGGKTGSGRSEVHVLSSASDYQTWTVHSALPIAFTKDADVQWLLADYGKPLAELSVVLPTSSGSGFVEVHTLSSASSYHDWSLHSATDLPLKSWPTWTFDIG